MKQDSSRRRSSRDRGHGGSLAGFYDCANPTRKRMENGRRCWQACRRSGDGENEGSSRNASVRCVCQVGNRHLFPAVPGADSVVLLPQTSNPVIGCASFRAATCSIKTEGRTAWASTSGFCVKSDSYAVLQWVPSEPC